MVTYGFGDTEKKQDEPKRNVDTKENDIHDQAVLKEIIKLLPCGTEYVMELYHKKLNDVPINLGKHDYVRIVNSLIRQFHLQLPEYVPLGNIFDSIYTIEEFVRRYRTCQIKNVSKK